MSPAIDASFRLVVALRWLSQYVQLELIVPESGPPAIGRVD
jgi:hypothetical protein